MSEQLSLNSQPINDRGARNFQLSHELNLQINYVEASNHVAGSKNRNLSTDSSKEERTPAIGSSTRLDNVQLQLANDLQVFNGRTPPAANNQQVFHNWQASKQTILERLEYLFNNEILSDIHFLVGKPPHTQRIPAHKFVLSAGSAVFDAMFNGGMAISSNQVELTDIEPTAFLALLRYLYFDSVTIDAESVMTTLYTAKKYVVPALESHCVEFLKQELCPDNAFMLLSQARLFEEHKLADLCLQSIDKHTADAIAADGFSDTVLDTLKTVFSRDSLNIKECKLFEAMVRWSTQECLRQRLQVTPETQRAVLDGVLKLIRFPLMTVEEFASGAAQSGILRDNEIVSLFLHFTVNPKPSVDFNDKPRRYLTGKEHTVHRFQQTESRWGYSGTSDRVKFQVNQRIFVAGLGLYGSVRGPSDYQVNIQMLDAETGKLLADVDTTFSCDGSNTAFRAMFEEPVKVSPNYWYIVAATMKGTDSFYGTCGRRKVSYDIPDCGKITFHFSHAPGNNNGTSVEDGQIPEIVFYV